jgi:hypothetical protein
MLLVRSLLASALVLASATLSLGQTTPAVPETFPTSAETPDRLLLKLGVNAGRAVAYGGYKGLTVRAPLTVGAEYLLSSRFTVYGQLDGDFNLVRQPAFNSEQKPYLFPSAALGIGGRYYYNQAGRARHNRPHGAFVGNYLGAELHTEMLRRPGLSNEVVPAFNVLWGMQRRLGRNFLFDFNAGVGLMPRRSDSHIGYSNGSVNVSTQLNLGLYFGR